RFAVDRRWHGPYTPSSLTATCRRVDQPPRERVIPRLARWPRRRGERDGQSDRVIIAMRQMLLEAVRDVAAGKDPPHVVRDPAHNHFPNLMVWVGTVPSGTDWQAIRRRAAAGEGALAAHGHRPGARRRGRSPGPGLARVDAGDAPAAPAGRTQRRHLRERARRRGRRTLH